MYWAYQTSIMTGKDGTAVQNFEEAVNRTVVAAVAVVAKVQMLVLAVVQGSFPHFAVMEDHLPGMFVT
ncbi:hypothetical protein SUGI_1046680 [Cryptomeria japonica]|nr:hypothetical protein SUGI_1046680 [Cryptomeria japonica]